MATNLPIRNVRHTAAFGVNRTLIQHSRGAESDPDLDIRWDEIPRCSEPLTRSLPIRYDASNSLAGAGRCNSIN